MRSRRIAVLVLVCVGLALVAVGELNASRPSLSREGSAPALETSLAEGAAATVSPPPPFSLPPLRSFAGVTERPLFSPTRQPAKVTSSGSWSTFVLAGIIITPEVREAMVLHNQPPTLVHLQEGEAVDGWTLASIFPDHAIFRNDAEEHELKLNVIAGDKTSIASDKTSVGPAPRDTSIGRGPDPPPPRG